MASRNNKNLNEEVMMTQTDKVDSPSSHLNRILMPQQQPFTTTTTVNTPSSSQLVQHMTIAGSFLDFTLFVADVEHLKFLLDSGEENIKYYTMLITLLSISLALQIVVAFLLLLSGFKKPQDTTVTTHNSENDPNAMNLNDQTNQMVQRIEMPQENNLVNNIIICLVTVIAIINVFVTVFGDRSSSDMIINYKRNKARIVNSTMTNTEL